MLRISVVLIFIVFISSCSNQVTEEKESNGQWILADNGGQNNSKQDKTSKEWREIFDTEIASCETSALEASIPKPKCRSSVPIRNCTKTKSFNSTFCNKPIMNRSCDIKSTQRYNDALFAHVQNCMANVGWVWIPKDYQNKKLQEIIDSIPELADWQKNNPEKWNLVSSIDLELIKLPEYQNVPTRERLLVAVKKANEADL